MLVIKVFTQVLLVMASLPFLDQLNSTISSSQTSLGPATSLHSTQFRAILFERF